jgi:hypothetical protein
MDPLIIVGLAVAAYLYIRSRNTTPSPSPTDVASNNIVGRTPTFLGGTVFPTVGGGAVTAAARVFDAAAAAVTDAAVAPDVWIGRPPAIVMSPPAAPPAAPPPPGAPPAAPDPWRGVPPTSTSTALRYSSVGTFSRNRF